MGENSVKTNHLRVAACTKFGKASNLPFNNRFFWDSFYRKKVALSAIGAQDRVLLLTLMQIFVKHLALKLDEVNSFLMKGGGRHSLSPQEEGYIYTTDMDFSS